MATNEELAMAINAGEKERLPELWNQIERFVAAKARTYLIIKGEYGGTTFEDLYHSGYIALADAVKTWSPDPGYAFISWLGYYLKSAFAEAGGYRSKKQKNDPLHRAGSIDAPAADDGDNTHLVDLIPARSDPISEVDDRIYHEQLHRALEVALRKLPPDEKIVIRAMYYQKRTLREIGPHEKDIERRALKHLRHPMVSHDLRQFLELRVPSYRVGRACNYTRASADDLVATLKKRTSLPKDYA